MHRIKHARHALASDGRRVIKCAEPHELPAEGADEYDVLLKKMKSMMRCHGNGTVDFLALCRMPPRHESDQEMQPFVEWFVSGLCAECQKKTFIV